MGHVRAHTSSDACCRERPDPANFRSAGNVESDFCERGDDGRVEILGWLAAGRVDEDAIAISNRSFLFAEMPGTALRNTGICRAPTYDRDHYSARVRVTLCDRAQRDTLSGDKRLNCEFA